MSVLDPYRALGLLPGATGAEIKRAYRRLAKQYHPDSAGEHALPRFLEIQAAYETLVGGRSANGLPTTPGARRGPGPEGARARSRESYGTRPGESTRTRASESTRTRSSRPAGRSAGDDDGASGSRPAGRGSGSGRSRSARQRSPRKATLGSTSYDEAGAEPFEPTWGGSTWYGTASGTYWTINPKEYADPRKHGPEYQERARRASQAGAALPRAAGSDTSPSPPSAPPPATSPPAAASPGDPAPAHRAPAGHDAAAPGSGSVIPFVIAGLGLAIPVGLVAASGSVPLGLVGLAVAVGITAVAGLHRGRRAR